MLIGALLCLGLLYWWAHDQAKAHAEKVAERQERCPHNPEWQQTIRVNSIMTLNPALVNRILPGRRWAVKHCRGCGRQRHLYTPTLQPFHEFKREFDQETIDRNAQMRARLAAHERDRAAETTRTSRSGG